METESTRQQKIGRQIQKDISDIFLREGAVYVKGVMATVTKVKVSPDLSSARVYVSVFPFDKSEEILGNLKFNAAHIRHTLGTRVKHQLRIVPELTFYIDDSLEYIARIDELLK